MCYTGSPITMVILMAMMRWRGSLTGLRNCLKERWVNLLEYRLFVWLIFSIGKIRTSKSTWSCKKYLLKASYNWTCKWWNSLIEQWVNSVTLGKRSSKICTRFSSWRRSWLESSNIYNKRVGGIICSSERPSSWRWSKTLIVWSCIIIFNVIIVYLHTYVY